MTWFSAIVLVVILLLLVLVVSLILMRRRRLRNQRRRTPDGIEDLVGKVAKTFARARSQLGQSVLQRWLPRWPLPRGDRPDFARRLLFIGPAGAAKTQLLQQLSRNVRYAATVKDGSDWPCQLFRVGAALGIELSGRVLAEDDARGQGGRAFQLALHQLNKLYPNGAIDGIALTISCQRQLLNQELSDCQELAQLLRKRLDNIRDSFGVRAPVYVLLTESNALPGFVQYCQRIGDRRHQILGWSNPDGTATDDPPDWVSQALKCVTAELTHEQIHRLSVETPTPSSDEYFVFPAALGQCETALRCYIDELFRERAEEAPQLRGIYFLGECSDDPDESRPSSVDVHSQTKGANLVGGVPPISVKPGLAAPSGAVPAGSLQAPSEAPNSRYPLLQSVKLRSGVGVGNIAFATDLFNGLILKEAGIAEPTEKALRARNRSILRWRVGVVAACVVYLVALIWESAVLGGRVASIVPALHQIKTSLDILTDVAPVPAQTQLGHQVQTDRTAQREYLMRQRIINLLDALGESTARRFYLFTAPWTSLWPTHSHVTSALQVGHHRIVLPAFSQLLNSESRMPMSADEPPSARDQKLEETGAYRNASDWVLYLERLELSVRQFNCLVGSGGSTCTNIDNLRSLVDLSQNLLDHELKPSFPTALREFSPAFWHQAGQTPADWEKPIAIQKLAPKLRKETSPLLDALNRRAFELVSEPVQGEISKLTDAAKAMTSSGQKLELSHLCDLSKAIAALTDDLKERKVSWIVSENSFLPNGQFEPGVLDPQLKLKQDLDLLMPIGDFEAYRSLLERLARLGFLDGTALAQTAVSELLNRLAVMRDWKKLELAQGLFLLKRERKDVPVMALSKEVAELKKPTDLLLSKEFMKEDPSPVPSSLDFKDVRLRWDVDPLKTAVRLLKEYEEWLQDSSYTKLLPVEFQQRPRELAQTMVSDATLRLVARAAHVEAIVNATSSPEDVLKSDTDSLGAANASLIEILSGLRRLHLEDPRGKIRDALNAQGEHLLGVLARSLDDAHLYNANYSNWAERNWSDGEQKKSTDSAPLAFRAFGVSDAGQLEDFLVKERTARAIKYVGDFAEPVITLLLSPEVNFQSRSMNSDVNYWFRNVKAVRGYESKQAGNSLLELERFIGTDLAKIRTHHDCTKYLASTAARNASGSQASGDLASVSGDDFFVRRRRKLRNDLEATCGSKSESEYVIRYREIRQTFETYLSNRFPFSTGVNVEDADPTFVRAVLKNAHELWSDYKDRLLDATDSSTARQREFLSQLDSINAFTASLWPRTESSEGFINVKVKFRANIEHEVGGNQIADWSLQLGDTRLRRRDKKTSEHWFLGDPVSATFRWAKDGPTVPTPGAGISVDKLHGLTATVSHQGPWALLRLIASHRVRSTDLGVQSENTALLRFLVPTHNNEAGGLLNLMDGPNAQLYIALTLLGDKDAVLNYPVFPTTSPAIERDPEEGNRAYEAISAYSASR